MPDKLEAILFLKRRNPAIDSRVPSAVTAVRLGFAPLLVFLVSRGMLFYGAVLFLFLLFTDFLDGYLARKLGVSSKFGIYFDATADFILVFCMLLVFGSMGFCADWVLILVTAVFAEFVLTSRFSSKIYDPVGKYYGSLLYGAIGLRFIFSGKLFYDVVTVGVVAFSAASVISRATFLLKKHSSHRIDFPSKNSSETHAYKRQA
ncbi:MAG: CDP-alcohol phosphatidyltransferase family protein [Candidatus Bathyarchaeota archaeon]|nr:CDP-alcohol phosphatidyltransferase family protein [Candidatus Bathyarchaeota archaeon]MDH5712536.1 CDP-alcohol phosphatidyltransferase family protein [Candidatus Bathyarchaeota archaeon]